MDQGGDSGGDENQKGKNLVLVNPEKKFPKVLQWISFLLKIYLYPLAALETRTKSSWLEQLLRRCVPSYLSAIGLGVSTTKSRKSVLLLRSSENLWSTPKAP